MHRQFRQLFSGQFRFPGVRLHFLTAAVILWTSAGFAQEYRGRVQGVVTDSSQAIVPGASVTLTNDATGVSNSRESDGNGRYLFDLVLPSRYTLTVEIEGFNRFSQSGILVENRSDITVNVALTVGAVS